MKELWRLKLERRRKVNREERGKRKKERTERGGNDRLTEQEVERRDG